VDLGNELSPSAARIQPTSLDWEAEPDALYTIIMTGARLRLYRRTRCCRS
jgi:hypothetical protein